MCGQNFMFFLLMERDRETKYRMDMRKLRAESEGCDVADGIKLEYRISAMQKARQAQYHEFLEEQDREYVETWNDYFTDILKKPITDVKIGPATQPPARHAATIQQPLPKLPVGETSTKRPASATKPATPQIGIPRRRFDGIQLKVSPKAMVDGKKSVLIFDSMQANVWNR